MKLENARWPQLPSLSDRIFVLPLGSVEQHGKHLPIFTDSLIIGNIANRVEELRGDKNRDAATCSGWATRRTTVTSAA